MRRASGRYAAMGGGRGRAPSTPIHVARTPQRRADPLRRLVSHTVSGELFSRSRSQMQIRSVLRSDFHLSPLHLAPFEVRTSCVAFRRAVGLSVCGSSMRIPRDAAARFGFAGLPLRPSSREIEKRKEENMVRQAAGEEALPLEDPENPVFRQYPEPSRLESLMISKQISHYCHQINAFAGMSFSKLFLASSLRE